MGRHVAAYPMFVEGIFSGAKLNVVCSAHLSILLLWSVMISPVRVQSGCPDDDYVKLVPHDTLWHDVTRKIEMARQRL